MTTTKILRITVPDNAGDPTLLVQEALERTLGRVVPVWLAPLDPPETGGPDRAARSRAIIIEEEN